MTAINSYPRGTIARLQTTVKVGATVTDPTTLTLQVMTPAGTETSYTYAAAQLTKSGTGVYYRDVTLSLEGVWKYRFASTGTAEGANWTQLTVTEDPFS